MVTDLDTCVIMHVFGIIKSLSMLLLVRGRNLMKITWKIKFMWILLSPQWAVDVSIKYIFIMTTSKRWMKAATCSSLGVCLLLFHLFEFTFIIPWIIMIFPLSETQTLNNFSSHSALLHSFLECFNSISLMQTLCKSKLHS